MRPRKIAAIIIALLMVISVLLAGFLGVIFLIERQRVQDADPAFKPLVPLGAEVLCNPLPFRRHCWYVVTFPKQSKLSDANTADLVCLNRLPEKNWLVLRIRTRNVTDASLPHVKAIHKIDSLDVTGTSISDAGIEELRATFPNAHVVSRRKEPAAND